METVELRCAANPRRLFAKLRHNEQLRIVPIDNLIEFKCRDCARDRKALAVFHRFNLAGELVETEVVSGEPILRREVGEEN